MPDRPSSVPSATFSTTVYHEVTEITKFTKVRWPRTKTALVEPQRVRRRYDADLGRIAKEQLESGTLLVPEMVLDIVPEISRADGLLTPRCRERVPGDRIDVREARGART